MWNTIRLTSLVATLVCAQISPDAFKTFEEIVAENGFEAEHYTVTTSDDYILSLYRIPGLSGEKITTPKPVVLMVHCQECDMMEWFWNDADKSNALVLAKAGYDVWFGNNRGTRFSDTHKTLTKDDTEYWEFYQQDMGEKDVPAWIDFILEKTGQDNLTYIGHSEGTTQMFLGASLKPDYFKEKVNLFVALAPVARTATPAKSLVFLSAHVKLLEFVLVRMFNIRNWFYPNTMLQHLEVNFCGKYGDFCEMIFEHMDTTGTDNYSERATVYFSNTPSGCGYRTFVYYAQMTNSGRYALYDYGKIKNKEIYGTAEAPDVPIQNLDIPVALFTGDLDQIADASDVAWLADQLGDHLVFQKEYHLDHVGFVLGKDASYFNDALDLLDKYN